MSKTTYDWEFLTQLGMDTLAADQGAGWPDAALEEPVEEPVRLLAGRYALDDILGRGGGGQVYRATDRLTGELVAVKLLGNLLGESLAKVRREISALRWLRLPGVVQLRDSGLAGGEYFIVMDLVEGRPFPGPRVPMRWEALAPTATELLEVLARVHLAGVVHRDLKPANVLVTRDGRPVVLDFGLAQGRAVTLSEVRGRAEGTPAYVSPEQIRGEPCDPRTDLYAVGCMLYEALVGLAPHGASPMHQVLQRRLHQPPPRIRDHVEDLPSHVAALIDRLLARSPDERPSSAAEALEALGGHPVTLYLGAAADLPLDHVLTVAELRPLFAGPDPFLHLIEDGARTLWARTGGDPLTVREELSGWVRAGLAHWQDDRLIVSRAALERLERGLALTAATDASPSASEGARELLRWIRLAWPDASPELLRRLTGRAEPEIEAALAELRATGQVWDLPGGRIGAHPGWTGAEDLKAAARVLSETAPPHSEARLRGMLAAELDADTLVAEVVQIAGRLMEEGRSPRALALLELGLELLTDVADADRREQHEEALLGQYVSATLRQESEPAMERALYELGRASGRGALQPALHGLVLGSLAARRREAARARELLDPLPAFDDEVLDVARQAARVRVASTSANAEERLLEDLSAWAQTSEVRTAAHAAWQGNIAYRRGRLGDAATHHRDSLSGRRRPEARMAAALNLATTLLDLFRLDEADQYAAEVCELATALRQPVHEALATLIRRGVAYRAGVAAAPQAELVPAAAQLNPYLTALTGLNEAAIAWRLGLFPEGSSLAALAQRAAEDASRRDLGALALGVGALCRGTITADEAQTLSDRTFACSTPGLRVQLFGLLALCTGRAEPDWLREAQLSAEQLPSEHAAARREVLSVSEALAALNPSRSPPDATQTLN